MPTIPKPARCGPSSSSTIRPKVTTADPREHYTYCELADWKREGLLKPSRVQVSPLFRLAQSDLLNGEPLGMLTERDRRALSLMLMPEDDGIA